LSNPTEYDAIAVGGGHNCLACGGYLAHSGLRTLILERRPMAGGACVKHILNVFRRHAPYQFASGSWEDEREQVATTIVETLTEFAPNIKNVITDQQVQPTPDLERIYSLPQGHIFHGELALDQLLLLRPIPGHGDYRRRSRVCICAGPGQHPGRGSGRCSRTQCCMGDSQLPAVEPAKARAHVWQRRPAH
jgi:phytoene dehydrogenase-like protein